MYVNSTTSFSHLQIHYSHYFTSRTISSLGKILRYVWPSLASGACLSILESRGIPYLWGKQRRIFCRPARKPITFPSTLPRFFASESINIFVGISAIFLASLKLCLFCYHATGEVISVVPYNPTAFVFRREATRERMYQSGRKCVSNR